MKRFYKRAEAVETGQAYTITLDGRPIRTPGKLTLDLPTRALAEALAGEWTAQGDEIKPETMPLTRLANSAIDRVQGHRAAVIDQIVAYAASDLVCYRAGEPADLVAWQQELWQPLLEWIEGRHGAAFRVTTGVAPLEQPAETLRAVAVAVARLESFPLTALHAATTACGSVVLGLALADGRLDSAAAWKAALLEELYQAERWGIEAEAESRRAAIRAEIDAAEALFVLCREAA